MSSVWQQVRLGIWGATWRVARRARPPWPAMTGHVHVHGPLAWVLEVLQFGLPDVSMRRLAPIEGCERYI